ncbi:MAG: 4a-hydroxytetrahydrobiopterin dehydratase [Myxococcales bacterium]|nr:4a-hydroxytetrahydrobiopterin dehydratase [Myxococcales bacterium]
MTDTPLADRPCTPSGPGEPPLAGKPIGPLLAQLPGWTVVDEHHLHRQFDLDGYLPGVEFINKIAALAEDVGHHPDLHLTWGKLVVTLYTHAINGLCEADFVLAARIDRLAR